MKRPADFAVRQRALDPEISFLVQAPAGSGKTELLIQRYLKLLGVAAVPEAVIAITFTKKAASEVQGRVIEALQAAAMPEPLEEHERETWLLARNALDRDSKEGWRLRENPSRMRIQTIDALALGIVRRMPWLARFGAVPEISENAKDLYREAARNTLALIGAGGDRARAIENLLLHLDCRYREVETLLAQMLEKREQWLAAISPGADRSDLRGALEKTLAGQIERELQRARAVFIAEFGEDAGVPDARDREAWWQMADWLLTADGKWRKRRIGFPDFWRGPATVDVMERLQDREDVRERLCDVRKLPPPQFDDCQWDAMQAALAVLPLAAAELQLAFREHGRVDFAELSLRACDALKDAGEPSDLALALGEKIEHILVDEFQDTSYTQLALLELLTAGWEPGDGRTLFLVGDPMQSIYRFRQAEVGIFLEARERGVGHICLEPLTLSANFRSGPAIVEWVNDVFDGILPAADDPVNGAVRFSSSTPFRQGEAAVRVHPLIEPEGKNEEAALVLSLLRASAGKTAILVRARSHLPGIVRVLRERGIPFQAVEIDELSGRPVIQDLLALTLALLNPAERVAWLALLRAPWCGLSLEDLHAIAGSDQYALLWDLLHRADLRLSVDGAARLARVLPALERALAERGRWPLRAWIEQAWFLIGGPACARDDREIEDAAAYFDLLEGLDEGGSLRDPAELKARAAEFFAKPDPNAPDSLQILTIHKAKGLEWDCVILPGLDAGTRPADPPLLRWQEVDQGEVLLAVPPAKGANKDAVYSYLGRLDKKKEEHEHARLLYVAATRAKRELHVIGCARRDAPLARSPVKRPQDGSLLRVAWDELRGEFERAAMAKPAVLPPASGQNRMARAVRRVTKEWQAPPVPAIAAQAKQAANTAWDDARAADGLRDAGTVVHAYLQRIAREGIEGWDQARIRAQRPGFRAALSGLGVSPSQIDQAAIRVETALTGCLASERGRWALGPHEAAQCEYAITGIIEGEAQRVVLDRIFVEDGVRWIVDYKTGWCEPERREIFVKREISQYRGQLERYARILGQAEGRPVKLALYFPMMNEWHEWDAPPLVRKQASLFD